MALGDSHVWQYKTNAVQRAEICSLVLNKNRINMSRLSRSFIAIILRMMERSCGECRFHINNDIEVGQQTRRRLTLWLRMNRRYNILHSRNRWTDAFGEVSSSVWRRASVTLAMETGCRCKKEEQFNLKRQLTANCKFELPTKRMTCYQFMILPSFLISCLVIYLKFLLI